MLKRHLLAFGVHPIVGVFLAVVGFLGLSVLLFTRTDHAAYIYALFALVVVSRASQRPRNEILKNCFSHSDYKSVRMLENILLALPFCFFLLFKEELLIGTTILCCAPLLFFMSSLNRLAYSIPTPFARRPFEFIVGFRSTFVVVLFAYFLLIMALLVGNFNLGIFSLIVVVLTSLTFYSTLEHSFYIWIFNHNPKQFLWKKVATAWWQMTVLCMPISLCLVVFYPYKLHFVLIVLSLGFLYLAVMILAKYAAYPRAVNLPQAILIAAGFWFPPLLIGIIPYFYKRACAQLQAQL